MTRVIQADLNGRLYVANTDSPVPNGDVLNPPWVSSAATFNYGNSQPFYFSPAVGHLNGLQNFVLAFASGSFFENDASINASPDRMYIAITNNELDSSDDLIASDVTALAGIFTDDNGTPADTSDDVLVTVSSSARITGAPVLIINKDKVSGTAVFVGFDPALISDTTTCLGTSFLIQKDFAFDTALNSLSISSTTIDLVPGFITGVAPGVDEPIFGKSGIGANASATIQFPGLGQFTIDYSAEASNWKELQ